MQLVALLYRLLLYLYPRRFQEEFGVEMTAVFAARLADASEAGWWRVTAVCLRELRDLPLNAVREHWRQLTMRSDTMRTAIEKPAWQFYPAWVVLSALSIPLAFGLSWIIISLIEDVVGGTIRIGGETRITEDALFSYVFVPAVALFNGGLQFFLLRRYFPRMGLWILATAFGWLLAITLAFLLSKIDGFLAIGRSNIFLFAPLLFLIIGGSIGLGQWWILRTHVRRAGWWIVASTVGWSMAGLVSASVSDYSLLSGGVLPGVVTSIAFWFLFAQPSARPLSSA